MAKTTKQIYAWMDKQIRAMQIMNTPLNTPLDKKDPFNVCIAGAISEIEIQIYGIDRLCKELNIAWNVEDWDDKYAEYYFMYRGYKFFGLVKKEETNEGK